MCTIYSNVIQYKKNNLDMTLYACQGQEGSPVINGAAFQIITSHSIGYGVNSPFKIAQFN